MSARSQSRIFSLNEKPSQECSASAFSASDSPNASITFRAPAISLLPTDGSFERCAIEVFVRFRIPFKIEEEETEIILNTGLIASVTGLSKVETGGGVFYQCAIYIITTVVSHAESSEKQSE